MYSTLQRKEAAVATAHIPAVLYIYIIRGRTYLITPGILAVPVSAKSLISSDRRSCANSLLLMSAKDRPLPEVESPVLAGASPFMDPFVEV